MKPDKFNFVSKPCNDAVVYLKTQRTMKAAWKNCPNGLWMLWAILFSSTARKITDEQKDALVAWMKEEFPAAYAYAYAYANANAYAFAFAYAYAYANAYANAFAYANAKIADWVRDVIPYPWEH